MSIVISAEVEDLEGAAAARAARVVRMSVVYIIGSEYLISFWIIRWDE